MADWGLLAGLGSGLSALGDGIDQYQMRKLAEEEQKLARQRQAEQDALQKAQLGSNEFRQMDALNFRPASNTDILNNVALKRGQTEFKSDVSGQTFLRDPGMSPTDLRQQNEQDKREAALKLLQERTTSQAEIARMREGGLDGRHDRVRADTSANNVARAALEAVRQAGANQRDANGSSTSRDTSLDKREDRILSMVNNLIKPEVDRYGEVTREALPHDEAIRRATAIVDGITNPGRQSTSTQAAGVAQGGEGALAQRAQQKIAEIQADQTLTPADKAQRIQAVNALLARKVSELRTPR